MIELNGKHNTAKVFTDNIDDATIGQVIELLNQDFVKNSSIRIMPDCHAGAGCVIGTTMQLTNMVVPNLVGVDIGCGMHVINIGKQNIDFDKLDMIIKNNIPSGFCVRNNPHPYYKMINFESLIARNLNIDRAKKSIGTLGGGNHFIEIDTDGNDFYLVVHTGSRNLGKQVAEYWQDMAVSQCRGNYEDLRNNVFTSHKKSGVYDGMQAELDGIAKPPKDDLCFLSGDLFLAYMQDMFICQNYAGNNRSAIADTIVELMGWGIKDEFSTIHNYIDSSLMLRKGAISAKMGEKVIIPINMRDGSIIAYGKGNKDWNESAPHGAGRLFGRGESKRLLSMDEFYKSMEGIYTSCIHESTLDESPMAYKSMEEIAMNTVDTIDIDMIIKPVYNFKASE